MNTATEILRANVSAAKEAFRRAIEAHEEICDRIEAAGGEWTGHETHASSILMGLWEIRDRRLAQAGEDLRRAQVAARAQLVLPGFPAAVDPYPARGNYAEAA